MQNATRGFLPKTIAIVTLGLITIVGSFNASAVDVYTDPVGFYKLLCQSNSDTVVSVPFTRVPEYSALIGGISGGDITISNASFTAGQWTYLGVALQSNHYYLAVASGTSEGKTFPVTNNTTTTLSVQELPEDLTGVAVGDRVQIIPYLTLNSVFPGGSGVTPSASGAAGLRRTEIYVPPYSGTNIQQASTVIYYYFTNATVNTWRLAGGGTTSRDNDILIPDGLFTVRQNIGLTSDGTAVTLGGVPLKKQRTVIGRNGAGTIGRDNYIALFRPTSVTLSNSGLFQSGAFRPSASGAAGLRNDELYVPDNATPGIQKASTVIYYYFTNATVSAWRLAGGGTTDRGTNQVFQTGLGFTLRVNNQGGLPPSPTTATWVNTAPY